MCGRYAFDDIDEIYEMRALLEEAAARLGRAAAESVKTGEVFPSERALVIAQTPEGERADVMEWGYPLHGSSRRVINARAETLNEKPMFAKSLAAHRCLVPCTGFYEWQHAGGGKRKYHIRPAGQLFFYMAGLYRPASDGQARFVIVTMAGNAQMRAVHDRMPLIVPALHRQLWLSGSQSAAQRIATIAPLSNDLELMAV